MSKISMIQQIFAITPVAVYKIKGIET